MNKFVLALTGPAGSGKSTISEKLAKKLEHCVNIDADSIKHMIVSGFYKNPEHSSGWGYNRWDLAGESIGLLAANFLKEGYSVVISGYIGSLGWPNIEKHVAITHKVLLLPELDVAVGRDAGRNSDVVMGREAVAEHHSRFSTDELYKDFKQLDTTNRTVDETVADVLKIVS